MKTMKTLIQKHLGAAAILALLALDAPAGTLYVDLNSAIEGNLEMRGIRDLEIEIGKAELTAKNTKNTKTLKTEGDVVKAFADDETTN